MGCLFLALLCLGWFTRSEAAEEDTPLLSTNGVPSRSTIRNDDNCLEEWFERAIIVSHKKKGYVKAAEYFGFVSGLIGPGQFFALGFDFGKNLTHNEGLAVVSGVTGFLPLSVLGARLLSHLYGDFVTPTLPEERRILEKRSCHDHLRHFFIYPVEGGIGIVAATPFAYLTVSELSAISYGGYVSAIAAEYGKATIDAFFINAIRLDLTNFIKPKVYSCLRSRDVHEVLEFKILSILKKISDSIDTLSHNEAQKIAGMVFRTVEQLVEDRGEEIEAGELMENIKCLLSPSYALGKPVTAPKSSLKRKLFSLLGGAVGIISCASFLPLAKQQTELLLGDVGMESETADTTVAWFSTIATGCLTVFGASDSFGKFYDFLEAVPGYCSNLYRKLRGFSVSHDNVVHLTRRDIARRVLAGTSVALAVMSSSPRAQLSIQFLGDETPFDKVALACSIIAPFSVDFWAINGFFQSLLNRGDPKFALKESLHKVINLVPRIKTEYQERLLQILESFDNPSATEEMSVI